MDDKETLHRRARLRELIRECFADEQKHLLEHIRTRTGKLPNQGEISTLCKNNGPRSFGDKKAKKLTEQIGLNRRWFDMPLGSNLAKDQWQSDLLPLSYSTEAHDSAQLVYKDEPPEAGPKIRGFVPLISWVQAGAWEQIVDNFAPGDAEEWMPCIKRCGPRTFALRVRGVSMHNPYGKPSYEDGDVVFIDPDAPAEHGKCVVVRIEGQSEATFKQLIIEGNDKFLRPLNPDWPGPKLIRVDSDATICGVAIGKWVE